MLIKALFFSLTLFDFLQCTEKFGSSGAEVLGRLHNRSDIEKQGKLFNGWVIGALRSDGKSVALLTFMLDYDPGSKNKKLRHVSVKAIHDGKFYVGYYLKDGSYYGPTVDYQRLYTLIDDPPSAKIEYRLLPYGFKLFGPLSLK
jgi:hypothetical protein